MSDTWLIRGTRLRRTSPDGGSYIYNALAFSTLLSSQETDAHRDPEPSPSLAATSLSYPVLPSCQIRPGPGNSDRYARSANSVLPSHQHSAHLEWCVTHATLQRLSTGGYPGLGPPIGVPSVVGISIIHPCPPDARQCTVVTEQYALSAAALWLAQDIHTTPRHGLPYGRRECPGDWSCR